MREISLVVIHCAATPNGTYFDTSDIDRWHKERGWVGIGYHYVILLDGTVEKGRDEEEVGAHVAGYNEESIGICLIGTDKFTVAQWNSLNNLLIDLHTRYPDAEIWGHGEIPGVNKACPGFDVEAWVENFIPPQEHILVS